MSREIKFRAWDTEHDVWVANWWYYLHEDSLKPSTKNVILQQYTGLTDKHGEKIYEGDVIYLMKSDVINSIPEEIDIDGTVYEAFTSIEKYLAIVIWDSELARFSFDENGLTTTWNTSESKIDYKYNLVNWDANSYDFDEMIEDGMNVTIVGNIYQNKELLEESK